ncbi:MAG TPA: VC0807 family protein [Microlunatus sp.]
MNERKMILSIVRVLFLDAGLAVGAYLVARGLGAGLFAALLVGTIVAGLRAGYVIIRRHQVDAFSLFMIATFGIGLVLTLISGSPRFLLAKDSIATAVSGLIFLGTLLAGKPMMFYLAQRFGASGEEERLQWQRLWSTSPGFRALFRRQTAIWAIVLLVEAAAKLILVLLLPVATMAPVVPFFTPVLITGLVVWTVRDSARARQRLQAAAGVAAVG